VNELIQPMVQIRNNSLVIYNHYLGSRKKSILQKTGLQLKNIKKYQGTVSAGARKRMAKAINLMVAACEKKIVYNPVKKCNVNFQLSFITLTIPDNTDIEIKEAHKLLLEPFLKWLRQVHKMKLYVWKCEVQKRGQLHYHITADCFVHYQELRNKWNKLIERASMMNEFKDKFGHNNPNSTDVHSVRKIKDLAAYLIKYFTKSEQNESGKTGKIWDCSLSLKKAKYYSTELTQDIEIDIIESSERKECKINYDERFSFVKFNKVLPINIFPKEVKAAYYKNLIDIRNYKREIVQLEMSSILQDTCIELDTLPITMPKTNRVKQLDLFIKS
jgi:hypothetical protein